MKSDFNFLYFEKFNKCWVFTLFLKAPKEKAQKKNVQKLFFINRINLIRKGCIHKVVKKKTPPLKIEGFFIYV
jgi:hypothetical protein